MSASAYAAYVIFAPLSVLVALAIQDISLYLLLKFLPASFIAVPLCFGVANYLRKAPGS